MYRKVMRTQFTPDAYVSVKSKGYQNPPGQHRAFDQNFWPRGGGGGDFIRAFDLNINYRYMYLKIALHLKTYIDTNSSKDFEKLH